MTDDHAADEDARQALAAVALLADEHELVLRREALHNAMRAVITMVGTLDADAARALLRTLAADVAELAAADPLAAVGAELLAELVLAVQFDANGSPRLAALGE